ncbi:MAG TPA: TlpA disulfide reductase family protein [Anaeromyxobacteraceae bacterium]|nr:TlpA disulfide reductase family protein [Anaeromyxobacteraceae bacterium]
MTTDTAPAPAAPAARNRKLAWTFAALGAAAALVVIADAVKEPEHAAPRAARTASAPPPQQARTPQQEAEERLLSEQTFFHAVDVAAPVAKITTEAGKPVDLAKLRGKVLFVNFWATWCPPCVEEMPSMLKLGKELSALHPGKFQMIAVSGDDDWEAVKSYFSKNFGGVPKELAVYRDADTSAAKAYYCTARGYCPDIKFPETYLVDAKGKIVAIAVGPRNWDDPQARGLIERLIKG